MNRVRALLQTLEAHPKASLSIILGFFSLVALGNMTRWSIWFDEAFGAYLIRFSYWDIVRFTALDVHPPLYYWLLKSWTFVFGASELGVRSMSLFFALIGLIGLYALLRRLFSSTPIALLGTFAASLSPMLVRFSDEARMYTLAFAIVMWATYVLARAINSKGRKWWVAYAILLATGMYTHYFVALAWLAHWAWRWYEVRHGRQSKFWTREWVRAHMLAVALFFPWLPLAVYQFSVLQAGFWIPPLSAYTPVDYLSNMLLYREYGAVEGWWAIVFYFAAPVVVWLAWYAVHARRTTKYASANNLLLSLIIIPVILLVLVSVPPLSSTFIDRYILYAQITLAALAGIGVRAVWQRRPKLAVYLSLGLLATAGLGMYNVYYYGNYNKNSSTSIRVSDVVDQISANGSFGQPIIAATPWIYYEASFYDSRAHRVYYLEDTVNYHYGSVKMLKNDEAGKIRDLEEFAKRHRYVWYLGSRENREIQPPVDSWERIESVEGYDYIDENAKYRASLFDTQPE